MSNKIINSNSHPIMDETPEEKQLKYVIFEMTEQERIVPIVEFAFHDSVHSYSYPSIGLYHEDIWDEGIRFNVQPISNSVRILIRPDVAKKEVKRILRKAIKIIDEDKYDWPQETDNYLKLLHGEMANRKSRR